MGYTFDKRNLKTKKDAFIQLEEVRAYRILDKEVFNFGEDDIKNDGEFGYESEDAYLEMDEQELEEIIKHWKYYRKAKKNKK